MSRFVQLLADIFAAQGNWETVEARSETVDTAGTAVQFNDGDSIEIPDGADLHIVADPDNSNEIYIGDSNVDQSDDVGFPLPAGEVIDLMVDDVSTMWIDSQNDGDGVNWIVEVDES